MKSAINLSLCYPYYRNPGMLALQYDTWARYAGELKKRIEVVICDDGSPEPAADVKRPKGLPKLSIYRIPKDRPWNQHAARNVTAYQAGAPWLFMTDMDHVLPEESLREFLFMKKDKGKIYYFRRLDAPDMKPKMKHGQEHPHPNTFALARNVYIKIGGYDERLSGVYGTDSVFRHCSHLVAGHWVLLPNVPIVRYDRAVQPDASTHTLDRDAARNPEKKKNIASALQQGQPPVVLRQEYERVV